MRTDFDIFWQLLIKKTLYYATSNNLLLHYLVKRGNAKIAFFLKCCISALPEFNQLLDFFNLFDSRLVLALRYDSLNSGGQHFANSEVT